MYEKLNVALSFYSRYNSIGDFRGGASDHWGQRHGVSQHGLYQSEENQNRYKSNSVMKCSNCIEISLKKE